MPRTVEVTRYVTPLREGSSLPALVEADDGADYVVKFRGAGHGEKALVAELLVGEIGRLLGLPVPELVLAVLPESIARGESHDEIRDLLGWSIGLNVGLAFVRGAGCRPHAHAAGRARLGGRCRLVRRPDDQPGPHAAQREPHRRARALVAHRPRFGALRPSRLDRSRRARPTAVRTGRRSRPPPLRWPDRRSRCSARAAPRGWSVGRDHRGDS